MGFYTADLCDNFPDKVEVLEESMISYGGLNKCAGVIETVTLKENNFELAKLLQTPGHGRIVVVNVDGAYVAVVGERMMKFAHSNGWVGIIVNGYVRDTHITKDVKTGLWALGTCPKKNAVEVPGFVGHDVTFGGVTFKSGAYVYADLDGIIVSNESLK